MEDIIETYIGEPKVIVEAGACDCSDTLKMAFSYKQAHIYSFECNPEMIPICKKQIEGKERITFTEKALSDVNGQITFYPIDTEKTITPHKNGNPGASSMFKAGDYPLETYIQNTTTVESTRLDSFMKEKGIESIDFMWLDAQGAELSIIKGLGDRLKDVKIIKMEVLFKPQYIGAPLFEEVEEYMDEHGFRFAKMLEAYEWFGDALFINKNL